LKLHFKRLLLVSLFRVVTVLMDDQNVENQPREVWKTFSLTHVEYIENDQVGKILAILGLTPLVIVVMFVTAFFLRRDLHTLTWGVGVILNEAMNYGLKNYIKEARPKSRDVQWVKYGMPSSHAQFMWFVSVYLVLFVFFRLTMLKQCTERLCKLLGCSFCLGLAWLVSYSRVYHQYHTQSQVWWGGVAGASAAVFWFILTQLVFTPLYPWVASWRISEWLLIRDCTPIPNIMWFEYFHTRGEANSRKKAQARKNQ